MNDRFARGQVWILEKDDEEEKRKMQDVEYYLTCKTRPWVIISDTEKGNNKIISLLPISCSLSDEYPCKVDIVFRKKNCKVKCDEIMTINRNELTYYWGCLDSETMNKIMGKVSERLLISQFSHSLVQIEEAIDRMIKAKINMLLTDEDVKVFTSRVTENIEKSIEEIKRIKTLGDEATETIVKNKKPRKPITARLKTNTEKIQFLKYYSENGAKKTMEKYDCSSGTLQYRKKQFMKELNLTI